MKLRLFMMLLLMNATDPAAPMQLCVTVSKKRPFGHYWHSILWKLKKLGRSQTKHADPLEKGALSGHVLEND